MPVQPDGWPSPERRRALVIVLDGAGVGAMPDASRYGDEGSNTLGHLARESRLEIPTLRRLGLGCLIELGGVHPEPAGAFGRMAEASAGKDSVTGHWELMGLVSNQAFPTFPAGFPPDLITAFETRIGRQTLGNVVASGTEIISRLGGAHVRTGHPIVYTSTDSVFQIAAHESVVPVDELYRWCQIAYDLAVTGRGVARVIARPFIGAPGTFGRTARRRDFTCPPSDVTLLDRLREAGRTVVGIGKIDDLFTGRGLTRAVHTTSDADGMDRLEAEMAVQSAGLIFTNLVDFDTVYGHRNDTAGYARNLEAFDSRLDGVLRRSSPTDLVVVTADHGNDPTTASTDHAREYVPLLVTGAGIAGGTSLGTRESFADLGQTLAGWFGVEPTKDGVSFLSALQSAPGAAS